MKQWLLFFNKEILVIPQFRISVATLFYNLSRENIVSRKNFYFSDVRGRFEWLMRKRLAEMEGELETNYLQNAWSIISVIAAAFLLLLTIIQAVCSIIQIV